MLEATDEVLVDLHDLVMLDLDGVVYVGPDVVPGAGEHLEAARSRGVRLAFVTNNAARPPTVVAEHLTSLGITAEVEDVVTSAQAASAVLADRLPPGSAVAALGGAGLTEALREVGLEPVGVHDEAVAVASGYGPDVLWRDIMTVAVRVRDGLPWVASNTDHTIPTPDGVAPGHGVLVDMLQRFTGVEPTVAGKPAPPLLETTIRRCGADRALMVGDRLDTDIAGGSAVDVPTLLVMTGVSGLAELASCRPEDRPTYLAADLAGLLEPQPVVEVDGTRAEVGGWRAEVVDGRLEVQGEGAPSDWWRAVATSSWVHLDSGAEPADTSAVHSPAR